MKIMLIISLVIVMFACDQNRNQNSNALSVVKKIKPGMNLLETKNILDGSGLEYSFDLPSHTLYAIERNTGGGILVKDNRQIIINFSEDDMVISISEKIVRTGL